MADGVGIAPTQPGGSLGFQDRGITALPTIRNGQGGRSCTLVAVRKHPPRSEQGRLLLTLHPEIGCQGWTRTNTVRFNKPSCYFDTTWHRLIGAAGRILTCIVPLRRRMPDVFDHGSNSKWSERQDFHLRPPGPKPGALKTELRSEKMADPKGLAPSAFPQTTGCSSD